MRRLIIALGAAALLGFLTTTAHAGTVTAPPSASGIAYLPAPVNLQAAPSGTWVNSGLQVTLTQPGTYALDANVHGRLWGDPPVNVVILARLFNVTSGAVVGNSTRLVDHVVDENRGAARIAHRATASISELITVAAPTTIRLQGTRINQNGASVLAQLLSSADAGFTSLRFQRIS
jgi:hypothetical protein